MASMGAFAIILNEKNQVLLCHRNDYDLWNLPGGKVEMGESPWEAVIREVKEETGYDAEISEFMGLYYKPEKDDLVFQFVCKIIGGKITLNEEADKIKYFDRNKIPNNTSSKQVERINDYFIKDRSTIMKKQLGPGTIDLMKQGKL
ncbi:NUDIX hydrolase [Candidatus Gracilibacteria bacterium]|nr:NUDIX hydrolase [Candidatus Gracilibacteria bacterium]